MCVSVPKTLTPFGESPPRGWQRQQQLDIGQDAHTFTHMLAKSLCDHSNEAESAKRSAKLQQHFSSVSPQLCARAHPHTHTAFGTC